MIKTENNFVFRDLDINGKLDIFGASVAVVLKVLFGKVNPEGKLPFELPGLMEAIRNQKPDVLCDLENPLYRLGFGLSNLFSWDGWKRKNYYRL